ncbi:hypothetical protein I7I51_07873 [Histoplasma capsulatum]|uniref:Uncharacterized protein n=1 Tax=Ajellomyces capsulatus TaxID=5037 RepID=A0A8A1M2M3_AJECA|nr:hypothetical protein I7I51_07873 [Histoplasma capsulatum]
MCHDTLHSHGSICPLSRLGLHSGAEPTLRESLCIGHLYSEEEMSGFWVSAASSTASYTLSWVDFSRNSLRASIDIASKTTQPSTSMFSHDFYIRTPQHHCRKFSRDISVLTMRVRAAEKEMRCGLQPSQNMRLCLMTQHFSIPPQPHHSH